MSLPFFHSLFQQAVARRPLLLHATAWTILLTLAVAVASFAPEIAFTSVISPASKFSQKCNKEGFVRIPLDAPSEVICFPARAVTSSEFDFFVPTMFVGLVVAGSACAIRFLGLSESEIG